MPTTVLDVNYNVKQVDLPAWEQLYPAPAVSSALSAACTPDAGHMNVNFGRYIYYLIAAASFYKYDTWTDTMVQLASPPVVQLTWATMRFAGSMRQEDTILAAPTATTIQIPAYHGQVAKGYDILVVDGTGKGQRRVITNVADPVPVEQGMATTIANALGGITITDNTKAWTFNQWVGYQVRIMFGAGVGQVRKILSNTATVLNLGDVTMLGHNIYANPQIFAPAIIATGTGVGSQYQIESSIVTVDTAFNPTLDTTSIVRIMSGSIFVFSSLATSFYCVQQFDILTDTWYVRTSATAMLSITGTDGSVERMSENAAIWERGKGTAAGTTLTLVDSTKNWIVNQWAGKYLRIWSGLGLGQIMLIDSNTSNTLTWTGAKTAPDATSQYFIEGFDAGICSTGGASTLQHSGKTWTVNRWTNYAVRIVYGTGVGQIFPIASNTADTLTTLVPWTLAPDNTSQYVIVGDPDKNFLAVAANATTLIHNLYDDVPSLGRRYDGGLARNASVQFGSNRAVAITSVSHVTTTGTVTTAFPHGLKVGQSVTLKGMTDANWNCTTTILTVPSATTFTCTIVDPAADTFTASQSGTVLVDATKNWGSNQWAGYVCYFISTAPAAASGMATGLACEIASNTATALTLKVSSTTPVNGTTRYVICARSIIGAIDSGIATGTQSGTTLQDTTKVGSFTGDVTGGASVLTISAVSSGSLQPTHSVTHANLPVGTVVMQQLTGTPGGIGTYQLSNKANSTITGGTIASGWAVNFYAGKRLKTVAGTGMAQELVISSNTSNTLTLVAISPTPVTLVTTYAILANSARGLGIELNWAFGMSGTDNAGRYMHIPRGGAVVGFDRLDLITDKWELLSISPMMDAPTTGSMYAYDGGDRLYFTLNVTMMLRYLDLVTNTVHGAGMMPYIAGALIIGNRMEIFTTSDGLKYLWVNRHSNLDCYKCLLFY